MSRPDYRIAPARSERDVEDVRALFQAYAAWLGLDLMYQGFADELAGLPGRYASPGGALLLARSDEGVAVGCVGLRPLDRQGCCEMKRLYVAPEARGHGVGRALVRAVLAEATRIGYQEIMLDSLPKLEQATAMYRRMGFRPVAPYYDTPIVATLFFSKRLWPEAASEG